MLNLDFWLRLGRFPLQELAFSILVVKEPRNMQRWMQQRAALDQRSTIRLPPVSEFVTSR